MKIVDGGIVQLRELLTESLGSLREVVGHRMANRVDWKKAFKANPSFSPESKTVEITCQDCTGAEVIKKSKIGVAFVVSFRDKPVFFIIPDKGVTEYSYYDFVGLIDEDDSYKLIGSRNKSGTLIRMDLAFIAEMIDDLKKMLNVDEVKLTVFRADTDMIEKRHARLEKKVEIFKKKNDAIKKSDDEKLKNAKTLGGEHNSYRDWIEAIRYHYGKDLLSQQRDDDLIMVDERSYVYGKWDYEYGTGVVYETPVKISS